MMMDEAGQVEPHQKIMTTLHRSYSHALAVLKQGRLQQGCEQLKLILNNEYMLDTDMQNLKYSSLMSLAQVQEALKQPLNSLAYYWQALQILNAKYSQTASKGQGTLKQINDERSDEQFTLLLKMIQITEQINQIELRIYLLKKAIGISPSLWRQKLLLKLQKLYETEGKSECLLDLRKLMNSKEELQHVLTQKIHKAPQDSVNSSAKPLFTSNEPIRYMKKMQIKLNTFQKQQQLLKYSSWQILLTISYALLKCQSNRNFSKKKYLHRRYDQNNKQWMTFLKDFSLTKTSIEIVFINDNQEIEGNRMENQGEEDNWSKMINDLANQLLRCQFVKKKTKKQINPLQELARVPSLTMKDSKNKLAAQTKSIFSSIYEYYRETMQKYGFKRELLNYLKFLDQQLFDQIFDKIMVDDLQQPSGKQGEENDDQDGQGSMSVVQNGKQANKQRKTNRTRKAQVINRNTNLNSRLKSFLLNEKQGDTCEFNNILEMVEFITDELIKSKKINKQNKNDSIIQNASIRRLLEKNILKVIQNADGFFLNYLQKEDKQSIEGKTDLMDMLMQKLQQLVDKDSKAKPKGYQDNKRQTLISFIKSNYNITAYQVQLLLSTNQYIHCLSSFATQCLNLIKLNSLYGIVNQSEVSYYRDLYVAIRKRQELIQDKFKGKQSQIQKKIIVFIDKQIQKMQKKVATRQSLLVISEEPEENAANTFDQIFKRDQQISLALPLLKIFNCLTPQLTKPSKGSSSEMVEQLNGKVYLQSFIKVSEIFFKKIQSQSQKQFNSRLLTLVGQVLRIKAIIGDIYEKFMHNSSLKTNQIDSKTFVQTMFYLIRFYLLNLYEENDNCIRIIFYISSILFRNYSDQLKYVTVPKCIYLYDELIKYKKFKPDLLNVVRKKFYHNLILKNLQYIYQSPIFAIKQAPLTKKRGKSSKSDEQQNVSSNKKEHSNDQHLQIKDRVFDILHDIYFCPEKEKDFTPKKIEEAVGYFMFLSRANHEAFQCKIVELQNQVSKIIKKCYKLYIQKRSQIYQYCQNFNNFKKLFQAVMNGDQNPTKRDQLYRIIKKQIKICECCTKLPMTHIFYVQTLFILGKFFQAQFSQKDTCDKQQWNIDLDKDQKYYFQYLALNIHSETAWQNIVRINCTKAYYYFDSLIADQSQPYKNKFLFTKRIINTVNEQLPHMTKLIEYGSSCMEILNTLKIKEREFNMMLKYIEIMGIENKESRDLSKKYILGLGKIQGFVGKGEQKDVKVRYLKLVEVRMKLHWNDLQKDVKEKQIIQIDEQPKTLKLQFKPSKILESVKDIINDIQSIVKDLPAQQKTDYVIHLEEDLVMEGYVYLSKCCQLFLQKFISKMSEVCRTNVNCQKTKMQDVQFSLKQLNYILSFFTKGDFLSSNQKYKLRTDQSLLLQQSDFANLQTLIDNLFDIKRESHQKNIEATIRELAVKKQKTIQARQQEEKEEVIKERQGMEEEENVTPQRKRSLSQGSNSSKEHGKSKQIPIDVGKYVCCKLRKLAEQDSELKIVVIQNLLNSTLFQQIILKMSKIIQQLTRVFISLPKFQMKKYKNRRSVTNSLVHCSQLTLKFAMLPDRANELIRQYFNIKSEQLVTINLHNEKKATEKNELLAQFYNREIVHQIMKVKFIQQMFAIYVEQANKEGLVILNRKLLRLSRGNQSKNVQKEVKEKEKQKLVKAAPIVIPLQQQGAEVKDIKQNKEIKQPLKKEEQKEQQIRCYFLLYCQGVLKFLQILRIQSQTKPVQQKYQKNLLQFKNRIKKSMAKDQINPYFNKIDDFLTKYEEKYQKKIKMKKTKKDKEAEANIGKKDEPKQLQLKPFLQHSNISQQIAAPSNHLKIVFPQKKQKQKIEIIELDGPNPIVNISKEKNHSSSGSKQHKEAQKKTKRVKKQKQVKQQKIKRQKKSSKPPRQQRVGERRTPRKPKIRNLEKQQGSSKKPQVLPSDT